MLELRYKINRVPQAYECLADLNPERSSHKLGSRRYLSRWLEMQVSCMKAISWHKNLRTLAGQALTACRDFLFSGSVS